MNLADRRRLEVIVSQPGLRRIDGNWFERDHRGRWVLVDIGRLLRGRERPPPPPQIERAAADGKRRPGS